MAKPKRTKSKIAEQPPRFGSEAEEAEWLSSNAGQRFLERRIEENKKRGVIYAATRTPEVLAQARRERKTIRYIEDPIELEAVIERAKAKSDMKMIALRLPAADIAAAKRLASKHGVGYQVLLKEIIHDALGRTPSRQPT